MPAAHPFTRSPSHGARNTALSTQPERPPESSTTDAWGRQDIAEHETGPGTCPLPRRENPSSGPTAVLLAPEFRDGPFYSPTFAGDENEGEIEEECAL